MCLMQQQNHGGAKMRNQDVRQAASSAGVRLWRIAEAMGIADFTLSRKLRRELPPEEKRKVLSIIQELAKEAV